MKLRFLLDQNISPTTKKFLLRLGILVNHIDDFNLSGKTDDEIYEFVKQKKFVLITFDQEFAFTYINKKDLEGLIILRIHPQILENMHKILSGFFANITEKKILGNIIVLEMDKYRIKKVKD